MLEPQCSESCVSSASAEYDGLRSLSPEAPCPYLPGRATRSEAYYVERLDGAFYERLLAQGFRRSGRVVYRPRCRSCRECRQMRIPVREFHASRSMRRIERRNADVRVCVAPPEPTEEKFELYCAYLEAQHDGAMSRSYESFQEFLYDSPTDTCEFLYYVGARLAGVSIADRCPGGLSSVYMYFDPAERRRSLGTFSILWEIDYCRRHGLPSYYLGFFVAGSETMNYKARFRPHQILVGEDHWVSLRG